MVGSSNRNRASHQESSPSSASVGNERDGVHEARTGSEQGSSLSAAPILNFENVPRRARNCQLPVPPVQVNKVDPPTPPVVHMDTTELAHTMATIFTEGIDIESLDI